MGDLPINKAFDKGINALKKRINEEGYWGEISPIYETATVLELFYSLGYNIDTEWVMSTTEGKVAVTRAEKVEERQIRAICMMYDGEVDREELRKILKSDRWSKLELLLDEKNDKVRIHVIKSASIL